jgi:hypothetical protein
VDIATALGSIGWPSEWRAVGGPKKIVTEAKFGLDMRFEGW